MAQSVVLHSSWLAGDPQVAAAMVNKPPMTKGCKGSGVEALQHGLLQLGFALPITTRGGTTPPDGIFGKETDAAVRAFQASRRLAADGDAGPNTLRALDAMLMVEELRPVIAAQKYCHAAVRRALHDRPSREALGSEGVAALRQQDEMMRANLLHMLPRQHLARSLAPPTPPRSIPVGFGIDPRTGVARRPSEIKIAGAGAVGANPLSAVMLGLIALATAVWTAGAVQRMPRMALRWPRIASPPPPDLSPLLKLQILMITIAAIMSGVGATMVAANHALIQKCKADKPGKVGSCSAAEAAYTKALNDIKALMTKMRGRPYVLASKSFIADAYAKGQAYNAAFAALIACLGCDDP